MNKKNILLGIILLKLVFLTACDPTYQEIQIGNQIWMTENLKEDKFRNGDAILQAKTENEWLEAGRKRQPAWAYYDFDPENEELYGKLYNWFAVNDPRGLAPKGWHIPSKEDWIHLTDHFGGAEYAVLPMMSFNGWFAADCTGNNESKFTAYPGGWLSVNEEISEISFKGQGGYAVWWSSTRADKSYGNVLALYCHRADHDATLLTEGLSVRCIK